MIPRLCRGRLRPSTTISSFTRSYSIQTIKLNSTSLKSITTTTSSSLQSFFPFNSYKVRSFSTSLRREDKVIKSFLLADIGEGITECEIVKWLVVQDQIIEEFDPVVEVMSDKATVEITSPFSGKITLMNGLVGDIVKVGGVLCEVETEVEGSTSTQSIPIPSPVAETSTTTIGEISMEIPIVVAGESISSSGRSARDVIATPSTRRIARESSVNLQDVEGTGKDGRVTKGDVMAFVSASTSSSSNLPASSSTTSSQSSNPMSATSSTPTSSISTSTSTSTTSESTILPLSPLRKAMFKAMTSTLLIPHFSYSETIDVTNLERMRLILNKNIPNRFKKSLTEREEIDLGRLLEFGNSSGISLEVGKGRVIEEERFDRLTLLPLLIKALSISLSTNPLFTCSLSSSSTIDPHLIHRSTHDISLAISPPNSSGLFTPLLPSVENSTPFTLASQISSLQSSVTKTSPPKFPSWSKGNGTITLSNVGIVGGRFTNPIIPPTGQLCIGAMGKIRVVPTYVGSEIGLAKTMAIEGGNSEMLRLEPRLMMDVTFSADHRVVEGVELAKLVETWKRIVEEPSVLVGY